MLPGSDTDSPKLKYNQEVLKFFQKYERMLSLLRINRRKGFLNLKVKTTAMKKIEKLPVVLFILMVAGIGLTSCSSSNDDIVTDSDLRLTVEEKADLQFMYEEEKLARDVYVYFNDKYDLNIFKNISSSEQNHMNYVLEMIQKYGLATNASIDPGIFSNDSLQLLHDKLIEQGNASIVDALIVGATIEDVDIRDLKEAKNATMKTDLINMYEKLECGSRNHMRGFTNQLKTHEVIYTPQFISQEQYDEILNGEHGHCG